MTDEQIISLILDELLTQQRLPRYKSLISANEELYDILPSLMHRGLIDIWQEDYVVVLPAGLATAKPEQRERIIAWTDGARESLAQAHRSNESKRWTLTTLRQRTGLSRFQLQLALLYRARFLTGCIGVQLETKTGLPLSTEFNFEIRRPRETLGDRIQRALAPATSRPPQPPKDLRQRLTNGEAPTLPPLAPAPATPSYENASTEALHADIDILLLTAAELERETVLRHMKPPLTKSSIARVYAGTLTFYIGRLGAANVALTRCKAGSVLRDGSTLAVFESLRLVRPRGIIAVGFAFGGYTDKLQIADVLVSSSVALYDVVRKQADGDISRSVRPESGPLLLNRFREASDWKYNRTDGHECKIVEGLILTGEELIDSLPRKVELFTAYPEAIGGEMEGSGLYAAAARRWQSEWIIIKAVCDWGDGTKGKQYQPHAADAAVSLVEHVLSVPAAFQDLPRQSPSDAEAPSPPRDALQGRSRDIRTLRRILTAIPASKLDYYLEIALSGIVLNETFFLWETFNAEVRASSFHLFDTELLARIRAFWNGWERSLSFGEHFTPRQFNPPSYIFSPSIPHEMLEEHERIALDYEDAVHEATAAYSSLMNYIKQAYPEIDLEEMNSKGHELLREMLSDDSSDNLGPKRSSSTRTLASNKAPIAPRGRSLRVDALQNRKVRAPAAPTAVPKRLSKADSAKVDSTPKAAPTRPPTKSRAKRPKGK